MKTINSITISNNGNLGKISGMNALQTIEKNVTINYNAALEEYCGVPKIVWNPEGSIKSFSLSRNKYNPTQAELFEGKCKP